MNRTHVRSWIALSAFAFAVAAAATRADEGMWLLNNLPKKGWKDRYQFEPSPEWVEHIQKSCVRIGAGGSGSFVSPDGLVMTNHHVASDAIGDLSTKDHDYMRDGFYARTQAEELKCPHMEFAVLMQIENVTDRVNAGVTPDMSPAEAAAARRKAMAAIEKEAGDKTGLQPEIVTLYHGARYDLYLYKRYTDVRLVFAPEQGIAFFGGDVDNFEYPRFNLDCAFLRAYEDGKPARVKHHLRWSPAGPKENELIFVAGHPGRTQRLFTYDHLKFLRDTYYPLVLASHNQREVGLLLFGARSDEHARTAKEDLYGVQNSRKAICGILAGLLDARVLRAKQASEKALKDYVAADPKRAKEYAAAWTDLAAALQASQSWYPAYTLAENRRTRLCRQYDLAKKLVRAAGERAKPDGQRLDEYREANLPTLEGDLFSAAPIYPELEQFLLADSLTRLGRILGGDHPVVKTALGGRDPESRAAELLSGTRLGDVAWRKKLYEGGSTAIAESTDPMIRFAVEMDRLARPLRDKYDNESEAAERQAYAKIARARFEKDGEGVYPDATFTLRLNAGTVTGCQGPAGRIPAMTDFAGAYQRHAEHGGKPPFDLPRRWLDRKDKLKPSTPFNFISTNDIIGGNSGSPMFNQKGEVTGLVFDGNLASLIWDLQYDDEKGRAVGVHSQAIIEALKNVYDAGELAHELTGS